MRYKSNKKTINRKNRRTKRSSRKNSRSRKRYSKRLRKRYKSRKNKSRRHKRTRRKRKSLKGGMLDQAKSFLGLQQEPKTSEKVIQRGRDLVKSVKDHIPSKKTRFEKAKDKFSELGGHKKKEKSHLEQLLHALETKLYPSMSAKLEHVEKILTRDVGFILSSLQKLAPAHFLEKIKLLKDTSELVCDYSHQEGNSFYDILNNQALTEKAMKSKESGKAFKVCDALHVCLKEKSSDQDFHFDLFHLQFSMPFHQMMTSFKEKTHQLLEGHEELKGFIAEVTDGYAHMKEGYADVKEHVEEKEKELIERLKGRLDIDAEQIKQIIREEINTLEKEIGTEIKDNEERLAKLLVKIKESDTFKAFEEHLKEGDKHLKEGDKHLEDIKNCMQHIALTEQINAMHFERDKIQLFSLLMIGCMCVQSPLDVIQGIHRGENRQFSKREFKIMGYILSGATAAFQAIGNPDNILKITVQALNHTIKTNPTVINQNEEIQELVDAYMSDQEDHTGQTSVKLKIILSELPSDDKEKRKFKELVENIVRILIHKLEGIFMDALANLAGGFSIVGTMGFTEKNF